MTSNAAECAYAVDGADEQELRADLSVTIDSLSDLLTDIPAACFESPTPRLKSAAQEALMHARACAELLKNFPSG